MRGDQRFEIKIIQKFENQGKKLKYFFEKIQKKPALVVVARVFTPATTKGRSSSAGGTRATAIRQLQRLISSAGPRATNRPKTRAAARLFPSSDIVHIMVEFQ